MRRICVRRFLAALFLSMGYSHSSSTAFGENLLLTVHPSKSGGDWWFGKTVKGGRTGLFPKTYVEVVKPGELAFVGISFVCLFAVMSFVVAWRGSLAPINMWRLLYKVDPGADTSSLLSFPLFIAVESDADVSSSLSTCDVSFSESEGHLLVRTHQR